MKQMSSIPMRFPVGIQSFAELRRGGYVYIDKTSAIKSLIDEGKYYFLSRPRRFGKSLLLSTIEAYFKGEKDLFCGLAIENYAQDVVPCPVLHLDLNNGLYQKEDDLNDVLKAHLSAWEKEYGVEPSTGVLSLRFAQIIKTAAERSGRKVVILVDEYDKPLLSVVENEELEKAYRPVLKAFYSNLKSMDAFIEFAMLTGVARFSKVSVFSDLNNLRDISFETKYSAICGITEEEFNDNLEAGLEELSTEIGKDITTIRRDLKRLYDGYHFANNSPDIYNPFSLMSVFSKKAMGNYWFESGTPGFLVKLIQEGKWQLKDLAPVTIDAEYLASVGLLSKDVVPVLYQTGYLTIKSYDKEYQEFTLDYPNEEVKYSFLKYLLKNYVAEDSARHGLSIQDFAKEIRQGEPDKFMKRFESLLAGIGYTEKGTSESRFQDAMYLVFTLLGSYAKVEERTSDGRIDLKVETDRFIYLFEFKIDSEASEAMAQLRDKEYWLPYRECGKQIFLIGVSFDSHTRKIREYQISPLPL